MSNVNLGRGAGKDVRGRYAHCATRIQKVCVLNFVDYKTVTVQNT